MWIWRIKGVFSQRQQNIHINLSTLAQMYQTSMAAPLKYITMSWLFQTWCLTLYHLICRYIMMLIQSDSKPVLLLLVMWVQMNRQIITMTLLQSGRLISPLSTSRYSITFELLLSVFMTVTSCAFIMYHITYFPITSNKFPLLLRI